MGERQCNVREFVRTLLQSDREIDEALCYEVMTGHTGEGKDLMKKRR